MVVSVEAWSPDLGLKGVFRFNHLVFVLRMKEKRAPRVVYVMGSRTVMDKIEIQLNPILGEGRGTGSRFDSVSERNVFVSYLIRIW